jgi:hypothetical protein
MRKRQNKKVLRERNIKTVKRLYLLHIKNLKGGKGKAMENRDRQSYSRIRLIVKDTLEGLTTLLKNMPEEQLCQTFDISSIVFKEFLRALLSLESEELKALPEGEKIPEKEMNDILFGRTNSLDNRYKKFKHLVSQRRDRIRGLWAEILSRGAVDYSYVAKLVGSETMKALNAYSDPNLRALYFTTHFQES